MKGGWLDVPSLPETEWEKAVHLARYDYARSALPSSAYVTDAACGMGYGTEILSRCCRRVVGYDLDPVALALARTRYPDRAFIEADIAECSFRGADALVSFETLEHLDDPWSFIDQLAPEVLICSAPIIPTLGRNPFHQHEWDEAGLRALIERRYVIDDLWRQRSPQGVDVYAVVRGHRR